jgi:hypothetical protein
MRKKGRSPPRPPPHAPGFPIGRAFTTRAGFPATKTPPGKSFITTAHAPTTVLSPMVTPGPMNACVHTHTPLPIRISGLSSGRFAFV